MFCEHVQISFGAARRCAPDCRGGAVCAAIVGVSIADDIVGGRSLVFDDAGDKLTINAPSAGKKRQVGCKILENLFLLRPGTMG